jgi:hypothetical protein
MNADAWLEIVIRQFGAGKSLAERAAAQVADEDFFREPAPGDNSVGVLMRHLGGNLRSRWTDFLTSDGEKPDRNRDSEFEPDGITRAQVEAVWEHGWRACLASLADLEPADLERTVHIRCEPLGVVAAIQRSLSHADYHCGQIVQVARHWAGDAWQTLSVPRGGSEAFLAEMRRKFGK